MNVIISRNTEQKKFIILMFLFLISFFDEAEISWLSLCALVATLLIPILILFIFLSHNRKFDRKDKHIILAFVGFMLIQVFGIRWEDLYSSFTPIYRSFTVLMIVLYFRGFTLTNQIIRAYLYLSSALVILGFATIFTPARENTNILFGNYNTVGVLYFTLTITNLLLYLKTKKIATLLLAFFNTLLILISNTRTALLLLIITLLLFICVKCISKKIAKPNVFFPLALLMLVVFIYVYYDIRNLPIYSFMNELSQKLFHKNFDSGRPELWHLTVETVGNRWILGKGTGIDLEFFYPNLKTPHSVYFDLYLQNGILGVLAYLICIIITLKEKGKWEKNNFAMMIMIIAFVFIFYNSVGIVFTKARSGIGLLQWALIALPYSTNKAKSFEERKIVDKSYCAGLQRKTVY